MRKFLKLFSAQSDDDAPSVPSTFVFDNDVAQSSAPIVDAPVFDSGPMLSAHALEAPSAPESAESENYFPLTGEFPGLAFSAVFGPGNPAGPAQARHEDFAPVDGVFDAKGGKPGGGGSGGTGTTTTSYFSGSLNGADGYDIWIEFKGTGWSAELQAAFKNAADYFTKVITADIGGGGSINGRTIDDLYVSAELANIDGTGGILGQAGATHVWTASELTAQGMMQFDAADALNYLNQGLWDDIVTHELMHVLGVGSLWNYGINPLAAVAGQYTGAAALAAYKAAVDPNATFIPVETEGGSGTAGAHWDEQTLSNELMTGYINNDNNTATVTDNYLSKFSVMSLADLGYKVGYFDYAYDGVPIV
jgi:Leishmanolysin